MFDIKHHLDENGATTQTKLSIFALLLPGKSHTISHLSYNNNGDKCDGPTYGTDWLVFRPVIVLIGPLLDHAYLTKKQQCYVNWPTQ